MREKLRVRHQRSCQRGFSHTFNRRSCFPLSSLFPTLIYKKRQQQQQQRGPARVSLVACRRENKTKSRKTKGSSFRRDCSSSSSSGGALCTCVCVYRFVDANRLCRLTKRPKDKRERLTNDFINITRVKSTALVFLPTSLLCVARWIIIITGY